MAERAPHDDQRVGRCVAHSQSGNGGRDRSNDDAIRRDEDATRAREDRRRERERRRVDTASAPGRKSPSRPKGAAVTRGTSPRRTSGPNWKLVRRVAYAVIAVILVLEGVSFVRYVTKPSSSPFGVRTVEWVRANVSSSLVNEIERQYYSWTAPSTGGSTLTALPSVGLGTVNLNTIAASQRPPRITPVISPALPGEGVWRSTGLTVAGAPAVLVTTFRSDPSYPRMVAGVAWIDQQQARVIYIPGRYEPAGAGPRGTMEVPMAARSQLLATFNSGFRLEDIHGGAYAYGTLFRPLVNGVATAVGYKNGITDVISWSGGPRPGSDVAYARQNLPLIVENGRPNPNLNDSAQWGVTLGNAIRVWRSGLGIDKYGNLIYAAANQQTVGSLAQILIHAGAVRAMESDINYEWVSFITYAQPFGGLPTKLLSGIDHGGSRYLVPDDRDFYAVIARGPVTSRHG